MKLHSLILRILIVLGVAAFVTADYSQFEFFRDSVYVWATWACEILCLTALFLPQPAVRLLGAGGIASLMLSSALFALHSMTGLYPGPYGPYDNNLKRDILESLLGLLLTAAAIAVVVWEVHQLKKPPRPVDPEEEEFTRNDRWDESPPQ